MAIASVSWLPVVAGDRARSDTPALTQPFGAWPARGAFDTVFGPLARWDAVHYLAIASEGYVGDDPALRRPELRPAFFPAYPTAVRVVSGLAPSYGAVLIAAYAVALAALFAAMVLLYRLTELDFGERAARAALLLFAVFPTAFYFGAPYSESPTLMFGLAAVYAARTGRWAPAGLALAACSMCRAPGVLVVVPVLMLYLYGPRADRPPRRGAPPRGWRRLRPLYGPRRDILWVSLALAGPVVFSLWLDASLGDGLSWLHTQRGAEFDREATFPLVGAWDGVTAAFDAAGDVLAGRPADALNVLNLGFFGFVLAAGIAMLRDLPAAYGAYVLVGLVPSLSSINPQLPLVALPRYVGLLFPIYIWMGLRLSRRRMIVPVAVVSALLLVYLTAKFAAWSFVG